MVLDSGPPPISSSEKDLTRKEHSTLAQLRSGYCRLLGSYKSRIKKDAASTSVLTAARCHMMSSISSFAWPPDYNDTVRLTEQTDGHCPGSQLSRGERPRLK